MKQQTEAGSLKRGVALLKLLATAGARGCPLTDLARRAGIPHPSAHRVLAQLIDENLVEYLPEIRRYRLGPLAFELGVAGAVIHDFRDLCEPTMARLAEATQETVYLVARSGFQAVCVHRSEGEFAVRTPVLKVGSRRPLGVGAGGLAILSALDPQEQLAIIRRVKPELQSFGNLTEDALKVACEEASLSGIAVIQNRVSFGVTAVGVPFRDSLGQFIAAVSVAALSPRMDAARIQQIGQQLMAAAKEIEARLQRQQVVTRPSKTV